MNTRIVLPDLAALQRQIAELEALLKAKDGKALAFKVTEKGAVSVYGLQRFPVTLYAGQWERLSAEMGKLKSFIEANADKVARKD
jgi:hypothetical protein